MQLLHLVLPVHRGEAGVLPGHVFRLGGATVRHLKALSHQRVCPDTPPRDRHTLHLPLLCHLARLHADQVVHQDGQCTHSTGHRHGHVSSLLCLSCEETVFDDSSKAKTDSVRFVFVPKAKDREENSPSPFSLIHTRAHANTLHQNTFTTSNSLS